MAALENSGIAYLVILGKAFRTAGSSSFDLSLFEKQISLMKLQFTDGIRKLLGMCKL